MFSKTHLKNGICLPERGHCCYRGKERAVSALFECLKGWQVGQVDRADVFSAVPVGRAETGEVKL